MAKKLVLMRHAKAAEGSKDFDRELLKTGKEQAVAIAELIQKEGFDPDLVLVSPAKRAYDTARVVAEMLNCSELVKSYKELYDGGVREYMQVLDHALHRAESVLLIAHNPTLSDLCALVAADWTKILTPSAALGLELESAVVEGGGKELFYFEANSE